MFAVPFTDAEVYIQSMQNNDRYDLSDRLIHFFRPLDLETTNAPVWPECTGYASVTETSLLRPQFLLRHAIRMGRLYATWSIRNNRRTVHGMRPAVCFTEMPIPAFIQAALTRAAVGEAISPYAIVFPKEAVFSAGARPVIYGLSSSASASGGTNDTPRLFDKVALPLAEQYRYVAYNPTTGKLDWSHEREWRWPLDVEPLTDLDGVPPDHSDSIPGLELDSPSMAGLGVVVATAAEAKQIVYDVLTKVDRGAIGQRHYQFVLAHETITNWTGLRDRDQLNSEIQNNLIDLQTYFSPTDADSASLVAQFDSIVSKVASKRESPKSGEPGGCWLWLLENTHPMVRALIAKGRITLNKDGKYLVPINATYGHNLQQREQFAIDIGVELKKHNGMRATYFSVLGKFDPDEVPFYNGDQLDDHLFYNWN
ncbi:DUF4427 domain-containing protein [Pseudochrobactrum asaccharolyticum]|uniref:Uncharacterized protein DUF4427 n=1 Tax=Pseudochrobactrum asaccharolyticum TaxID=354351 RepID=A0A366DLG1_9HYPH|nr:DUF4427 domain-containing protein [Pseudochrobactrum asaccharolyticum]RBO90913.1 uncharacterized protein DUF4427 [Pseudochrobactrum asaccharolyticum]